MRRGPFIFFVLLVTLLFEGVVASANVGKCPADANRAPAVYAGRDFSLDSTNQTASLNGLVTDDGLPVGSTLRISWSVFSGPGRVTFNNSNSPSTTATFSTNGIYVLKLTADDGEAQSSDLTEVRVGMPCPVQDISGLVDWWPANGTPMDKITGQAAILGSGASYTNGEVASAFNFSGVSNFVWMAAQTNSNFNLGAVPAGFTVEFWMKPFYQQNQCILGWANGVRFERVLNSSWGDGVACYLGGTNSGQYVQSGSVFGSGNYGWYHVAVTYDRALGQGRIYINGALRNTVTVGTNLLSTAGDFYLGQVPGMTTGVALYAGQLDEVSLYNRPLASNEVAAIYNAGSAGKCMTPPNQPPVVSAGGNKTIYFPTNSVTLNGYAYDDGLPSNTLSVVWAYVSGTNAVTFSSLTNAVTTITFTNTGSYAFQLAASDGQYTSTDLAAVTVLPDPRIPPTVTLTTPATNTVIQAVNGAANLALAATAADTDGRITSVSFWLNGSPAGTVTNLPYAITVSNLPPATYTVTAVATDSDGLSTTSAPVTATIYVDTGAPAVAIFAPADSAIITAPSNIVGTVDSPILQAYQLQYRMETPDGTNAWVTLTTGTTAVSSNVLGKFDPTLLLNGIYEMRLTASDLLGRTNATDPLTVIVDRNLKVGNFTISFNDLSVAVPGLPIQITRTYDSRAAAAGVQGDFGAGWTMDIRNVRLQKNRPLSRNWDEYVTGDVANGDTSTVYHLDPGSQRIVTITFPDGRVEKFLFTPDPMNFPLADIETPKWNFTPMGNTRGTLLPASYDQPDGQFLQFAGPIPGTADLDDFNAFWDYVDNFGTSTTLAELQRYPTLFRYTSDAGYVYLIDEIQGLQSVTDPNGNMLVMSTNGLAWQNPAATTNTVSVAFQRDTLGRITNILDLAGNSLSYEYDTNGNLVTFTDRNGNTNGFAYENLAYPNYLTGIYDGGGTKTLLNQFDDSGRLSATLDASGNATCYGHDLANNVEYITNRLGAVRMRQYDDHGNVTMVTDPLGLVYRYAYDENGNLLSEQKGTNAPRVYSYDGDDNRISATDEMGRTRTYTYGLRHKVLTATDPEGNTTTNTYDSLGNLLSTSDPLGNVSTFTYDKTGNVLSLTDPQGHVTGYAYDNLGHLSVKTDALGNVFTYVADADGKLLQKTMTRIFPTNIIGSAVMAMPATTVSKARLSAVTRAATTANAEVMLITNYLTFTYLYDASGNLLAVGNDGRWNTNVYNYLGRVVRTTDALNRETVTEYNTNGLISSITHPKKIVETFAYDAENHLTNHVDGLGRATSYAYDLRGNVVQVTHPDGRVVSVTYNQLAQIDTETDFTGTTSYTYDLAGNRITVTDPQGRVATYAYNAKRACTNYTDFAQRTTSMEYDALNRNVKITYPDQSIRSVTYFGKEIASITDQLKHTTSYTYDANGCLLTVTDPLNDVTTYTYDSIGNPLTRTDALGRKTSYTYDDHRDLLSISMPDGSSRSGTYDEVGRLLSQTDGVQKTTSFEYDDADNLTSITDPAQQTTTMEYNAAHQRTSRTDPDGNKTTWTYDDFGRLTETQYPDKSKEDLTYDGNSQLLTSVDRLGRKTTYKYNEFQCVSNVTTVAGSTSFGYDAAGNRTSVTDVANHLRSYVYDVMGRCTNVNFPDKTSRHYEYDDAGRLTSETDQSGNTTVFAYDEANRRTSVKDPMGLTTAFKYDAGDQLTSIVDPKQQTTAFTYDGLGRRIQTTLPNQKTLTTVYDGRGLVLKSTDPANGTSSYTYDDLGRVATYTDPLNNITQYAYDPMGRVTQLTDAKGQLSTFKYDSMGHRTEVKTPDGGLFDYTYSPVGQVLSKQDVYGNTTTYTYDPVSGKVASITDPLHHSTVYHYDGLGRCDSMTDALQRKTSYQYDDFGRITSITHPPTAAGTAVENFLYDSSGRLIKATDALQHATSYSYDSDGRLTSKTDALNRTTSYGYDNAGQLAWVTDPAQNKTQFDYDSAGNMVQITFPDSSTIVRTYDGDGRVTSVTDQNVNTTSYTYDAGGNLKQVNDALQGITSYEYDQLGCLTKQSDALQRNTTYGYDPVGRRTGRALPTGVFEKFTYDGDGNLDSRTDFNGHTTLFGYDAANRLVSELPDSRLGERSITYGYNEVNDRTSMSDASGGTDYTYDPLHCLTSKTRHWSDTQTSATLSYDYDLARNVTGVNSSMTNGVSIGYGYDAINRLTAVDDGDGITSYHYNPAGAIDQINHPNRVTETIGSDALSRVTSIRISNLDGPLGQMACQYDQAGNRLSAFESLTVNGQSQGLTNTYSYDQLYRLTSEAITGGGQSNSIGYNFDAVGNRQSRNSTVSVLPSYSYGYDADDRLTSDVYDANGNTVAATMLDAQLQAVSCYDTYDHADRLIQRATTLNQQPVTINLQYDGDGERVGKVVNGARTHYLVDDVSPSGYPQVLEEHTDNGAEMAVSRVYSYGNGPASQEQLINGQWQASYFGRDAHGSVRYLTDISGQITDTYDYDAYGNIINQTGATPNTRLFAGEEFDPDMGMQYLRARYRDPQRGRFWTRDDYEGELADPASRHGYNYCQNDPVNNLDPSGHFMEGEMMGSEIATMMAPALQNLQSGVMGTVYGLLENSSVKAKSQAEAMMIQSTSENSGVMMGQQNYWDAMRGAPFLLMDNPFVAPTPALVMAPVVVGFDPSVPIYGAGLRNPVLESGNPNAGGMIDPSAAWNNQPGRQNCPTPQDAAELGLRDGGLETKLAAGVSSIDPEAAADMAASVSHATRSVSDTRAALALALPKGASTAATDPQLMMVSAVIPIVAGPTPAEFVAAAPQADPAWKKPLTDWLQWLLDKDQKYNDPVSHVVSTGLAKGLEESVVSVLKFGAMVGQWDLNPLVSRANQWNMRTLTQFEEAIDEGFDNHNVSLNRWQGNVYAGSSFVGGFLAYLIPVGGEAKGLAAVTERLGTLASRYMPTFTRWASTDLRQLMLREVAETGPAVLEADGKMATGLANTAVPRPVAVNLADQAALAQRSAASRTVAAAEAELGGRGWMYPRNALFSPMTDEVGGTLAGAAQKLPRGFANPEQFKQAGAELKAALEAEGVGFSRVGVRGSSVTGVSSKGGGFRLAAENGFKASDIDVFIEFSKDVGLTASKKIPGFIHPDKIMREFPSLKKWSETWSKILGRDITPGGFKPGTFTDSDFIEF